MPHAAAHAELTDALRPVRTLRLLPKRYISTLSVADNPEVPLAFVSYRILLSLYPDGVNGQKLHGWKALVRRVAPPANPDKEGSSTPSATSIAPKVLVPGGDTKQEPTSKPSNEVLVMWSPEVPVPDGHVTLVSGCDNAEDWDLVK